MDLLRTIFTPGNFEPHIVHFADKAWLVWAFYGANAGIALAYTIIPISLPYILKKRRDIPFNWVLVAYAGFIISCGITHVMHIIIFTYPVYYLQALMDVITAVISLITAYAFVFIVPDIVQRIPDAKKLSDVKTLLDLALVTVKEEASKHHEMASSLRSVVEGLQDARLDLDQATVTYLAKG